MRRPALLACLLLVAASPGLGQEVVRGHLAGPETGGTAQIAQIAQIAQATQTAQIAGGRGAVLENRITSSVELPAGSFRPLYTTGDSVAGVAAFRLDSLPVTVGDFLAFVEVEPRWRKGEASTLFVGDHYLAAWEGPLKPGDGGEAGDPSDPDGPLRPGGVSRPGDGEAAAEGAAAGDRPVTEVSWFAARAFCQAAGGRLPTTDEWEYAASVPEEGWKGNDRELDRRFLQLHGRRPRAGALPPVGRTHRTRQGVWDLHGLVQEWTDDFNNQMLTGAGRDDRGLDRQLFCAAGSVGVPDPSDYAAFLRASYRASLDGTEGGPLLGFRCAYDIESTR